MDETQATDWRRPNCPCACRRAPKRDHTRRRSARDCVRGESTRVTPARAWQLLGRRSSGPPSHRADDCIRGQVVARRRHAGPVVPPRSTRVSRRRWSDQSDCPWTTRRKPICSMTSGDVTHRWCPRPRSDPWQHSWQHPLRLTRPVRPENHAGCTNPTPLNPPTTGESG